MNKLNDFLNNSNPLISILLAVIVLLVLGGICVLITPLLAVLSYIIIGVGVLLIIVWIIRSIINIFK
jgi:hypothetical protein